MGRSGRVGGLSISFCHYLFLRVEPLYSLLSPSLSLSNPYWKEKKDIGTSWQQVAGGSLASRPLLGKGGRGSVAVLIIALW